MKRLEDILWGDALPDNASNNIGNENIYEPNDKLVLYVCCGSGGTGGSGPPTHVSGIGCK